MSKDKNLKIREWSEKIDLWKLSGKRAQAWCRENHVIYTTFLGWRNRLEINKTISKPSLKTQFIELNQSSKK